MYFSKNLFFLFLLLAKYNVAQSNLNSNLEDTSYYKSARLSIRIADMRIQIDSNNADAYLMRGYYYGKIKNYNLALADIEKYESLRETNPTILTSKGYVYAEMGKPEEAILCFKKAITLDSNSYERFATLIQFQYRQQKYRETLETIAIGEKKFKLHPDIVLLKGYALEQLSRHQDAFHIFDELIQADSSMKEAFNNRGLCYFKLGNNLDALKDINQALKLDSLYPEAYDKRASVKIALNDMEGALTDLNKALELYPTLSTSLFNRSLIYISFQEYGKALEDVNLLISQDPKREYFLRRAKIYHLLGNLNAANEDLLKAEE